MQGQNENHRATKVLSKTSDYDQIEKIIQSLQDLKPLTLQAILNLSQQHKLLRQDSVFLKDLFQNHSQLILEMIEWLFTPEKIIKRKNVKPALHGKYAQPFLVRLFIYKNVEFYNQMYEAAKNNTMPISLWFNFLMVEDLDQAKIATSLGYFQEILVSFATPNYQHAQFCPSGKKLTQSENIQPLKNSEQLVNDTYSVLPLFTEALINSLLKISYIESVFIFLMRLIISSFQQPFLVDRGNNILSQLYVFMKNDDRVVNNMSIFYDQILKHLSNDQLKRGNLIIEKLLQNRVVENSINRIVKSPLCQMKCNLKQSEKQDEQQRIQYHLKMLMFIINVYNKLAKQMISLEKQQQVKIEQGKIKRKETIKTIKQILQSNQKEQNSKEQSQTKLKQQLNQQTKVEFKILQPNKQMIEEIKEDEEIQILKSNPLVSRKSIHDKYDLFKKVQQQVKIILKNLPNLHALVKGPQRSTVPFSSGEDIVPITIFRVCYFQLLLKCLQLVTDHPSIFIIDMDKLDLFPLIERYLVQNKWNNISQRIIQKIAGLLIVNNYDFFRQNNMEKNTVANSFIGFLIENFNNKDYVFLKTVHFSTKGDLHCLYKIAKAVAFQLNNNKTLIPLINSFQPWKKFILEDLKKYQEKVIDSIHLDPKMILQTEKNDSEVRIEIDQIQSIKKLLRKIQTNSWPIKPNVFKKMSHIQRSERKIVKGIDSFDLRNSNSNHHPKKQPRLSYPPTLLTEQCEITSDEINRMSLDNSNNLEQLKKGKSLDLIKQQSQPDYVIEETAKFGEKQQKKSEIQQKKQEAKIEKKQEPKIQQKQEAKIYDN